MTETVFDKLKKPFPKDQIHWRIGATNKRSEERKSGKGAKATSGIPLAYIDARNVMERLDDVMGPDSWQCRYPFPGCCEIGLLVIENDLQKTPMKRTWVWKSNGAGETDIEGAKGQYSDAFKRAAVLWGVGQYLYSLPNTWVDLDNYGNPKERPKLPQWALPGAKITPQVRKDFYKQVTDCLSSGDSEGVAALFDEWDNDEQILLWAEFNSVERRVMKKYQGEER